MQYDSNILGISRNLFVKAMQAEGLPVSNYARHLIQLLLYGRLYGNLKCYDIDSLSVVRQLWDESMILTSICRPPLDKKSIDNFVNGIKKSKKTQNIF